MSDCSAVLLDLCPQVLSPRNTKNLYKWVLASYVLLFGGQMQHFGPRSGPSWPSWAPLRYLEATAMLLGAKLGILRASWAIGRSC